MKFQRPTLVVFAGLPASGKSFLAEKLVSQINAVILNKDPIRAALFPPEEIEYSRQQDDFCMGILYQTADYLLKKDPGRAVIIDGRPYARSYQVQAVLDFFQGSEVVIKFIHCLCSEETAWLRLKNDRSSGNHVAANRNFELYLKLRAEAESNPYPHLIVDTDRDAVECLQSILAYLSVTA